MVSFAVFLLLTITISNEFDMDCFLTGGYMQLVYCRYIQVVFIQDQVCDI